MDAVRASFRVCVQLHECQLEREAASHNWGLQIRFPRVSLFCREILATEINLIVLGRGHRTAAGP